MALKIYWSQKATQKFDKIIDYLEEHWGERAKKLFIKKTFDF
jgi:plasmid stabilization system protein ParE